MGKSHLCASPKPFAPIAILLLTALSCLVPAALWATERGYQPRDCGFDMNRNGILGEPADCNVCNGGPADGDADGSAADVIYVSCATDPFPGQPVGIDHPGCGAPGDPCASLTYAFATIADGPADGAEDIVCFRNTCREDNLSPRSDGGGVPGTYLRPASGSQARDWLLPADPVMLVGWDVDADGVYPPHDPDHAAVLMPIETCPGTPNQACLDHPIDNPEDSRQRFHQREDERAIYLANDLSNVELAHFTVRDHGRYTLTENSGFFDLHQGGSVPSVATQHVYIHDIEAHDLNRDSNFNSRSSAINTFNWRARYVLFENLRFTDNGHWFARGGGDNRLPDYGPFRWQNISLTLDACKPPPAVSCDWTQDPLCPQGDVCFSETGCEPAATDSCATRISTSWKIWGHYSGLEVLDSVLDANVLSHPGAQSGGRARGIDAAQCTQDWTIRNNELIDFNSPIELVPESSGACGGRKDTDDTTILEVFARPVTDVVIDRNLIRHPAPIGTLDGGITLKQGGSDFPGQVLGDVTITNNVITSDSALESCMLIEAGHGFTGAPPNYQPSPVPGAVRIVGNTCYGPITLSGAIVIGNPLGNNQPYLQENIVLHNNLVGGINSGTRNVATTYAPTGFDAAGNVWDPDAGFRWNATSGSIDLATWSALSGDSAIACIPTLRVTDGVYANGDARPLDGDLHLAATDICAQDAGIDVSAVITVDFDGEDRPRGSGWDVGADEIAPPPLDQPPLRFGGAPTGTLASGTTATTLSLRTDQSATCDLALGIGVAYGDPVRQPMTSDPSGTSHSLVLSGLTDGQSVQRFARCQNSAGVTNLDDYEIAFQIANPSSGSSGHWPFDEASGCAAFEVTSGRDGSLAPSCPGNAPARIVGQVAGALDFDGVDDYVEVPHDPALSFSSSFTVGAWIRPLDFGDGGYGRILAKQKYAGGFGAGYSFYLGDQPTGNPPARRSLCANIGTAALGCGDDEIIEPGVWQHVALVFDDLGDRVSFYVDGEARGGFDTAATPGTSAVPLRIGDRDDLLRSFHGAIDEAKVWDRALSPAEIAELTVLDSQPPLRLAGSPSGNLPATTSQVDLELDTNKVASCRYALAPGVDFGSMTGLFGSADGRHHSAPLTLDADRYYRFYVRCEDDFGNVNDDDFEIAFFVGFHPTELSETVFFVESRHGLTVARGTDLADFENYCDLAQFPDGCIRRWQDQSGYIPPQDPDFVGRDFGQDDAEKPGLVPDCLAGLPCVRGGRADQSPNWAQDLSFEIELGDEVRDLPAGFSAYLLARPVAQAADYAYFGFAGSTLTHRVADDSLHLSIDNQGLAVAGPGAITNGAFQLIEIHRDANDQVQVWVDGQDVTLGDPVLGGGFDFRFLFSLSRVQAMHGDIAAFLLVDGALDDPNRAQLRDYFAAVYGVPAASAVAHWPFDEASGCAAFDSRGTFDGTLAPACPGNAPGRVAGRLGGGLDFDGDDDYVEIAHDQALAFTGSFTAAAWIRPDSFGDAGYGRILAKQKYLGGYGSGYSFYLADAASGSPAATRSLCANVDTTATGCGDDDAITLGIWQHVVLVFDDEADAVRFYVDGQPRGSFANTGGLAASTVPLRIGDRDDLQRSFDGAIDEVRLWNRALGDAEIATLAASEQQPPQRFDGAPTGQLPYGTTSANLSLRTDQPATCDVAAIAGLAYGDAQRQTMSVNVTGTLHTLGLNGLSNGDSIQRFVRCATTSGVANSDDFVISFAVAAAPSGPVAHWRFDQGSGCSALDSLGNHDGLLAPSCPGNEPNRQPGQIGGGLDFDGVDDYVEVAHDPALAFTGSFTAAAWIRPLDYGDSDYGRILAKQKYVGGFGAGYSFYLADSPAGNPAASRTLCANIDTGAIGCADDDALTLGIWQHVVLVFDDDADSVRFYVDGQDRGGFTTTVQLGASTVPLRIGDRDDLQRSFYGSIDEVQLWDRALGASEIAALPGIEVSTLADTVADDGETSLREAIAAVNDGTLPAGTAIRFAPGLSGVLRLDHPAATLRITRALSIHGGSVIEISGDADGNGLNDATNVRVIEIEAAGADVHLTGLRITGGRASGADIGTGSAGGGLFLVAGRAIVEGCHFADNQADIGGAVAVAEGMAAVIRDSDFVANRANIFAGGLVNYRAVVEIERSRFVANHSSFNAGAIYNLVGTAMTISASAIEGNSAAYHFGGLLNTLGAVALDHSTIAGNTAATTGGGLGSLGGALTLYQSTVSGNQLSAGDGAGAGLWADNAAQVQLDHSTIAFNSTAGNGGGLLVADATVTLAHTLIAANSAAQGAAVEGTIDSLGYNLFDQLVVTGNSATDLLGATADLGSLADHGGPTRTHLPGPSSAALDAGDPAAVGLPATDQRGNGFARLADGNGDGTPRLDIGAVEVQ